LHSLRKIPGLTTNWHKLEKACILAVFKEQKVIFSVHWYVLNEERQALPTFAFPIGI